MLAPPADADAVRLTVPWLLAPTATLVVLSATPDTARVVVVGIGGEDEPPHRIIATVATIVVASLTNDVARRLLRTEAPPCELSTRSAMRKTLTRSDATSQEPGPSARAHSERFGGHPRSGVHDVLAYQQRCQTRDARNLARNATGQAAPATDRASRMCHDLHCFGSSCVNAVKEIRDRSSVLVCGMAQRSGRDA